MQINEYAVYIITNKNNTVLYIGVTSDLQGRILQHKRKILKGFTAKYECNKLVYFEQFQWVDNAIAEKNN